MNNLKILFFTILCSIFFISCSDDDTFIFINGIPNITTGTTNSNGEYAISFGNYSFTRASVGVGPNACGYDNFKLYAWNNLGEEVMNPYEIKWLNNEWIYNGVNSQETKYFNNLASNYSFIGVISDKTATLSNGTVVVNNVEAFSTDADGTENTPKEFLYSSCIVEKTNYANGVNLAFKHGNAKVVLKFISNDANTKVIDLIPSGTNATTTSVTAPTNGATQFPVDALPNTGELLNTGVRYGTQYIIVGADTPAGIAINDCRTILHNDLNYFSNSAGSSVFNGNWTVNGNNQYYTIKDKTATDNFKTTITNKTYTSASGVQMNLYDAIFKGKVYNVGKRPVRIERISNYLKTSTDGVFEDAIIVWMELETNIKEGGSVTNSPLTAVSGIKLVSATSVLNTGADAVITTLPSKANVTISTTGATYVSSSTVDNLTFTIPTSKISTTPVMSPTTQYVLPTITNNYGFTLKFSYEYKGVNVYDTRVWLPKSECNWEEGKIYTYTIAINGVGNGKTDITDNNINSTDPVVSDPIKNTVKLVNVTITDYTEGGNYDHIVN